MKSSISLGIAYSLLVRLPEGVDWLPAEENCSLAVVGLQPGVADCWPAEADCSLAVVGLQPGVADCWPAEADSASAEADRPLAAAMEAQNEEGKIEK